MRSPSSAASTAEATTDVVNPRYAWYGDDFTGASDTLATVAQGGLRAFLFLGVPTAAHRAAVDALDALGIAGAARALAPAAMERELAPVAAFFATLGARVLHYKCCSTFDSAPHVGNLGVALRVLGAAASNRFVPIVGGQPGLGRYCAFGNLFAAAGDGAVHRIDRHPTMSVHPVTPMNEADLRRHLAAQGIDPIALVDARAFADGATLDARFAQARASAAAVLFDALDDAHLAAIGRLLWQEAAHAPLLALGASSVAQALLASWPRAGGEAPSRAAARFAGVPPSAGAVFVLAGSQSPVTAQQLEAARAYYEVVEIDVATLAVEAGAIERTARNCARVLDAGRALLAHTGRARADGPPTATVARLGGELLRRVLELAPQVRRIGVAGGDTSSLAIGALGIWGLQWTGAFGPGVSLLRARSDDARFDGVELLLKGGQMGRVDLFERLLGGTG